MDFRAVFKRVKARTYKSKRELKGDVDLTWSKFLTHNAAPVRHFHHAGRINHSCFYVKLLRPPSDNTRKAFKLRQSDC